MGFLSLLGLMVTGGIALSGTARNTAVDDREKAKERALGHITYYDHRLILRRISDDAPLNPVWGEHGKYELCDKKTYLGLGIYIVDEVRKKEYEDKKEREEREQREREYNSYSEMTHNHFVMYCNVKRKDVERANEYEYRNNPQQYWYIPYLPFSAYGLEAGRANWSIHTKVGSELAHGYEIYDSVNDKFVFLLVDFRKDKVNGIEPLEAALRYVIDDLEDGKSYLLDLTSEIICFQPGEYTVDAVPRCLKGSQVELPADHSLLQDTRAHWGTLFEGFSIKKATDWERECVERAYKLEKEKKARMSMACVSAWSDSATALPVSHWKLK